MEERWNDRQEISRPESDTEASDLRAKRDGAILAFGSAAGILAVLLAGAGCQADVAIADIAMVNSIRCAMT
jgi:hypothetical protein